MFEIGQRVVCVDDYWVSLNPDGLKALGRSPGKGSIYTIEGTRTALGTEFLVLCEFGAQHGWAAVHFRPLDEKEEESRVKATIDKHFSHHLKDLETQP